MATPKIDTVMEAIKNQQWAASHAMLSEVLRANPNHAKALYLMAVTEARLGHYGLARADLARAKALEPKLFPSPIVIQRLEELLAVQAKSEAKAARVPHVGEEAAPGGSKSRLYGALAMFAAAVAGAVAYGLKRRSRS